MPKSPAILKEAEAHVKSLMKAQLPTQYVFHDFKHTKDVVRQAQVIADKTDLSESDKELLLLAAWFHDVGYIQTYDGHESESIKIAEAFLRDHGRNEQEINTIAGCIESTRYPQEPESLVQKVMCDADLAALGGKEYMNRTKLLRTEWETALQRFYPDYDWLKFEIEFLESHNYHTEQAAELYDKQKESNLLHLRALLKKTNKRDHKTQVVIKEKERKMEKKKDKQKEKQPTRGIETMFRVTSVNHIRLSAIADNKANIMLSINAIIISIVLSSLVPKFDKNMHLILPTMVLVAVCVFSIIFATLSTMPKVNKGIFTRDDILNKRANLLFFGNFYRMDLDEFEEGVNAMMADKDFLYGSMTRDLYFLGKVLAKKYQYLRTCYMIFMYGLIIAVIAFVVGFLQMMPA
jgi:predicted metal-dependent HD superfamily phosphohydrolase